MWYGVRSHFPTIHGFSKPGGKNRTTMFNERKVGGCNWALDEIAHHVMAISALSASRKDLFLRPWKWCGPRSSQQPLINIYSLSFYLSLAFH